MRDEKGTRNFPIVAIYEVMFFSEIDQRRTSGKNGLKCGMLFYPDHLQNLLILASIGPCLPSGSPWS